MRPWQKSLVVPAAVLGCVALTVLACSVALSGATVGGQTRGDTVPRTAWGAPDLGPGRA